MADITRAFGWKPQEHDPRDEAFQLEQHETFLALPETVDLRPLCPDVYDQGELGSCTAQAVGFLCHFNWMKQKKPFPFVPSRLFIYYNEREMEGTIEYDAGAMIRSGIKSINRQGYCPEKMWPYVVRNYTKKPSRDSYTDAKGKIVKNYGVVKQTVDEMKAVLAAGYPIVIGFNVYESFMENQVTETGLYEMPDYSKESIVGGHAVAIVGYRPDGWIVRNSWGKSWGMNGYCIMPFEFLADHEQAMDLWCVRFV